MFKGAECLKLKFQLYWKYTYKLNAWNIHSNETCELMKNVWSPSMLHELLAMKGLSNYLCIYYLTTEKKIDCNFMAAENIFRAVISNIIISSDFKRQYTTKKVGICAYHEIVMNEFKTVTFTICHGLVTVFIGW